VAQVEIESKFLKSSIIVYSFRRWYQARATQGQPEVNPGSIGFKSGSTWVNPGSVWGQPATAYLRFDKRAHHRIVAVPKGSLDSARNVIKRILNPHLMG
jgi:hypothetical protein